MSIAGRGEGIEVPLARTLDCRRDGGRLLFIIGWAGTETKAGSDGSRPLSERGVFAARGWAGSLGGSVADADVDVAAAAVVLSRLLMALQPLKIASARVSVCGGGIGAQTAASLVWAAVGRPKPLWTNEDKG